MPKSIADRKVRIPPVKPQPGERPQGGRPPYEPSERQRSIVKMLAVAGFPHTEICKAIRNPQTGASIDRKTLELHFREELDTAFYETAALTMSDFSKKLTGAGAVYDPGTKKKIRDEVKSDTRAQIFFLSSRLKDQGWSTRFEHTGKDGAPLTPDFGAMPDDVLDAFIAELLARSGRDPGGTEGGDSRAAAPRRAGAKRRKPRTRNKG